jgi:16S rRNA (uracil1498-N3)-methyltransferase
LGVTAAAIIQRADKKSLLVSLEEKKEHLPPPYKRVLAISILKNAARFEWMLEKVTEIGISEIIPMISERTERTHFREDRMQQIVISAALQSKQYWMPVLRSPSTFEKIVAEASEEKKYIAHCLDEEKSTLQKNESDTLLLIGPEGDFTPQEIKHAIEKGFHPVALGSSRLRTETAGVVGSVLMNI